jgi:hypothetical protein
MMSVKGAEILRATDVNEKVYRNLASLIPVFRERYDAWMSLLRVMVEHEDDSQDGPQVPVII